MGFAVFVAADDLTVVTTMLRPIINDLGLTIPDGLDDAAWIVNAYLIAFVAVMPIAGRLSDVIGRRRLLIGAFALFLVGTIVIPLSTTMGPLLVGRVLTALAGGAMLPVALAAVGDVYDEERRSRALGTLGAIETLGWVWGPLYGAALVRFLDWRWQFWLNIPLAIFGMVLIWRFVPEGGSRQKLMSVDWIGALLLAGTLVALDLALLGNAEIQSVTGLDQLQGGDGFDWRLLYPVALGLGALFVWQQRRTDDPLVDRQFFAGRVLRIALFVNVLIGAAIVIAMVDVPIFVNAIEIDIERSAVIAGWLLAALTAAMAVASWVGGRIAESRRYQLPTMLGLGFAVVALVAMGFTWEPSIGRLLAAGQLALLGAGIGLVFAPTTAAVIDASAPEQRGAAASIVMVLRLIGLSVGLAALTAWGLARFNALRKSIELPAITDPGFQAAITEASARLTADAIAETFLAAGVLVGLGLLVGCWMREPHAPTGLDPTAKFGASSHRSSPNTQTGRTVMEPTAQKRISAILVIMGIVVLGLLVMVGFLVRSVRETRDDLAQTQAELARVEQGAAGSALVATQVLALTQQLGELQPTVDQGLSEAIAELENFGSSTLEFNVAIDETISLDTEIVIDREFSFPIDETIPIDQTVDTTIEINTGLGFDVPVDITVPVQVEVPIALDVDIPLNETVPITTEVPVKLDVPISVDLAETELSNLADQLVIGLRNVQEVIAGLAVGSSG